MGESQIPVAGEPKRSQALRRGASMLTAYLCWTYAIGVLGIFTLIRFAGERWWPATVLLFSPRWVWIAPLALLIPMAAIVRRRLTLPALLAAVVVLFGIMDFRVPWRLMLPDGGRRNSISLFTCNLHGNQADAAVLNAFVNQTRPSIIVLQNYSTSRRLEILREGLWHTRRDRELYVASRYPLRKEADFLCFDASAEEYAREGLPLGNATCYAIDAPGGTFHLVNLHLASPHLALARLRRDRAAAGVQLAANSLRRGEESQTINARVQQIGGPFVLAGDFNTPDDSPLFKTAWSRYVDAFSTAGFGFGATYDRHRTWLRIDHVLCDRGWHCTECRVGDDVGSGHHPVFAVLQR